MNKSIVMRNFLKTNGGEYVKEKGKWYWKKEGQHPELVTLSFLRNYKPVMKVEEQKIEIKKEVKKSKPKKSPEIVNNEQPIISEIANEDI